MMAYSEAQKRATLKYRKEKRARMGLEMKPEEMELLNRIAKKTGESRTALIKRLIKEEADRLR